MSEHADPVADDYEEQIAKLRESMAETVRRAQANLDRLDELWDRHRASLVRQGIRVNGL